MNFVSNQIIWLLVILLNQSLGHLYSPLFRFIPPEDFTAENMDVVRKKYETNSSRMVMVNSKLNGRKSFGYYLTVEIGTPPQKLKLVIDTGSSNTAVAGQSMPGTSQFFNYRLSNTYKNKHISVDIKYDSGAWAGIVVSDNVNIPGVVYDKSKKTGALVKQSGSSNTTFHATFDLIFSSEGFFNPDANWDGILGLAYPVLTMPAGLKDRSTVFDNLVKHNNIENMFSVALCSYPGNKFSDKPSGHFIAGGIDHSLYEGPLEYITVRRTWFYEVIISRINIDSKPIILTTCKDFNRDKTIIDTGTSLTMFPEIVYHSLISHIQYHMKPINDLHPTLKSDLAKSSPFWSGKAAICVANYLDFPMYAFPEIHFELVVNDTASVELALSPQNYISVFTKQGFGPSEVYCFKLGFLMSQKGTVLGNTFMEGFYFVFDRKKHKIGIAQSKCNSYLPANKYPKSRIIKVNTNQKGLMSCAVKSVGTMIFFDYLTTSLSIMLCILFGVFLLPAIIILLYFQCREYQVSNESTNLFKSNSPNTYNSLRENP